MCLPSILILDEATTPSFLEPPGDQDVLGLPYQETLVVLNLRGLHYVLGLFVAKGLVMTLILDCFDCYSRWEVLEAVFDSSSSVEI